MLASVIYWYQIAVIKYQLPLSQFLQAPQKPSKFRCWRRKREMEKIHSKYWSGGKGVRRVLNKHERNILNNKSIFKMNRLLSFKPLVGLASESILRFIAESKFLSVKCAEQKSKWTVKCLCVAIDNKQHTEHQSHDSAFVVIIKGL